jgi:hypothetical protein
MKAYGGVDVWIHVFLTSALIGGEWSASRPGLDDMEKTKFLSLPGLEFLPSVVQLVASHYTDWAILAHHIIVSQVNKELEGAWIHIFI